MKYFLLTLTITLSLKLFAKELLLQNPQESRVDYQVFLNLNSNYVSYSQYLRQLNSSLNQKILNEYKLAKLSWSQGLLHKAQNHFRNATLLALASHPSQNLSKLIFDSYLRIYQIQTQKEEQLILNALAFYEPNASQKLIYGPNINTQLQTLKHKKVFSLKTLLKEQQKNTSQPFYSRLQEFDLVIVNTKALTPNELMDLPFYSGAKYHITFISEKGMHLELKTTANSLPDQFLAATPQTWQKVIKHSKNVYQFQNHQATPIEDMAISNLKPNTKYYVTDIASPSYFLDSPQPTPFKDVIRNKWFWIGVTAITTAVYLSQQQNRHTKDKTVVKDGF